MTSISRRTALIAGGGAVAAATGSGGTPAPSNVASPPVTPAPALRGTPVTVAGPPVLSKAAGHTVGDLVLTFTNTGTASWTLSALRLTPVSAADGTLASGAAPVTARNLSRPGTDVDRVRAPGGADLDRNPA